MTSPARSVFYFLLHYLRPHWRIVVLVFGLTLLGNVLEFAVPAVLRFAVDAMAGGEFSGLWLYAAAIVALALAAALCRFGLRYQTTRNSRIVEYEMRRDLFNHLQRLDSRYYQRARTGDLMARATNDLGAVRNLVGPGILQVGNTAVVVAVALALMWRIDAHLTLYCSVLLPLLTAMYLAFKRRIERRFQAVQEQFSNLSAAAQDNFSGIRVIKAYAQEGAEIDAFREDNCEYVRRSLRLALTTGMLWPLMSVVSGVATVVVLYLGGRDVIVGRITIGQFVQFVAYLGMLTWPMIALGWVVNLWQQGMASLVRVREIFAEQPAVRQPRHALRLGQPRGEIEFRRVSFSYGRTPVLEGIDLRVPAGATVGIVGATGAGKSSLVQLIPRLFDPTSGQVLLDGVDVRRLDLRDLRRAIAYVPQETFLFSEPLAANVAFGLAEVPAERVAASVAAAGLSRDLEDLPSGLSTMIGERGVTLSGGQKQRAALARALVRDPVVLVLDDVFSSVDTATTDAILRRLRELRSGRTTLAIAHRVSVVQHADLIVVLRAGRIAEQGTHNELLARGGLYAGMYRRQLLREELSEGDD